jgi:hypothetical protein
MWFGQPMAKTLSPKEAAPLIGRTEETLRQWRRKSERGQPEGPPYVMMGGKPVYHRDLIQPGSTTLKGLQEAWPPLNVEVRNSTDLSEVERTAMQSILDKMPVQEFEFGDKLVIVADGLDTSDPTTQEILIRVARAVQGEQP